MLSRAQPSTATAWGLDTAVSLKLTIPTHGPWTASPASAPPVGSPRETTGQSCPGGPGRWSAAKPRYIIPATNGCLGRRATGSIRAVGDRPMRYDAGLSVIRFRRWHASSASPASPSRSRTRSRSQRIDVSLKERLLDTRLPGDLAVTQPPHGYETRVSGAFLLTVAPADAGGAQRVVARTAVTACVSAPPIGRRRLSAPRPPAWPIALGSIRARDAPRESAHRSRLAHWSRSMARDDHLGGPSAHSTTAETSWPRRESREPGGGERSSACHRSPAGVRRGPLIAGS